MGLSSKFIPGSDFSKIIRIFAYFLPLCVEFLQKKDILGKERAEMGLNGQKRDENPCPFLVFG